MLAERICKALSIAGLSATEFEDSVTVRCPKALLYFLKRNGGQYAARVWSDTFKVSFVPRVGDFYLHPYGKY